MQAKFEQALEAVRSLSTQDYERLWQWMQERRQEKHAQQHQSEPSQSLSFNESGKNEQQNFDRRCVGLMNTAKSTLDNGSVWTATNLSATVLMPKKFTKTQN